MKSMKTNGQVLSEKEMKEVKGGCKIYPEEGRPKLCPICCSVNFKYDSLDDCFTCDECGCVIPIEENENDASI